MIKTEESQKICNEANMKEQLEKIYKNATDDLSKSSSISDLDEIRAKYLSRKGEFNEIKKNLKNLSDEDITNLKLEVLLENQDIIQIDLIEVTLTTVAEGTNSFTIDKIPAIGLVNYSVVP